MKPEYEAIVAAGFDLQVDCPDLAMGRHIQYANLELTEFRKRAAEHVEALNGALARKFPPTGCGCICAGAIMKGRTIATSL